jgi:hypothetical protein
MDIQWRRLTSWERLQEEFERTYEDRDNVWVFRGQSDASWHLETTLERVRASRGIPWDELPEREGGLIRRFKRQYHHYSADAPDKEEYPEWLALMQHYGAPTRLLDWTYSFFVGVFFAVESGLTPAAKLTDAAVWALNTTELEKAVRREFREVSDVFDRDPNIRDPDDFKDTFNKRKAFACQLNSYRHSQRLTVQQGVFVCPGDVTRPFEDNLAGVIGEAPEDTVLVKLIIDRDQTFRKDVLKRLHRMNTNRATLFPGLDGFACSLKQLLCFPKEFLPPDQDYLPDQSSKLVGSK